jgi:phosphoglycerate dehydrogenase-like enzyme
MKKSAILINTARGAVVDENDLIAALKEGKISGAGLDVLTTEPPSPGNALLGLENVILTPHSAAFTEDAIRRLWVACSNAVIKVLNGGSPEPSAHIVNPEALQRQN